MCVVFCWKSAIIQKRLDICNNRTNFIEGQQKSALDHRLLLCEISAKLVNQGPGYAWCQGWVTLYIDMMTLTCNSLIQGMHTWACTSPSSFWSWAVDQLTCMHSCPWHLFIPILLLLLQRWDWMPMTSLLLSLSWLCMHVRSYLETKVRPLLCHGFAMMWPNLCFDMNKQ